MMTNVKIELTDEQRVSLQRQLTGKSTPVTRAQINSFVSGVVTGAISCEEVIDNPPYDCYSPRGDLTDMPAHYAKLYENESVAWKQGWVRGWNAVGSSLGK